MESIVRPPALHRHDLRQLPSAAALTALGVVYGDIGTSALYGFKQAASAAGTISPETIMGIVSVIFWALVLVVSFKYAILIMRADNRGEGGIVALLALLDVRPVRHDQIRLLRQDFEISAQQERHLPGVRRAGELKRFPFERT